MNDTYQRLKRMVAHLPRPGAGKHAKRTTRRWPAAAATTVVVALGGGIGWVALAGHDITHVADATHTDCPAPTPQQTDRFLAELELAGVTLPTPEDRQQAAAIGAKHVEHCHLIGMRWQIERDLRADLPHLSDQQVRDGRVGVEHLFLDVTGRKQ